MGGPGRGPGSEPRGRTCHGVVHVASTRQWGGLCFSAQLRGRRSARCLPSEAAPSPAARVIRAAASRNRVSGSMSAGESAGGGD